VHENKFVHEEESLDRKAIRLLNRQLGELQAIRGLNSEDPAFTAWHDATRTALDKFLGPESHHTRTFCNLMFLDFRMTVTPFGGMQPPPGYVSPEDLRIFREGCSGADATLRAAIRHVEDYGVCVEELKPAPAGRGRGRSGGINQTFHAPVTMNQAIATDSAVQRIGHLGDRTGAALKEISDLLQQSQDLTPRQVRQGIADVEALAVEVEKDEHKRNWGVVLEHGQRALDLAGKAVDLGTKLGPLLPTVVTLMENAKHFLR
jgi:hypothetical protein